MLNISTRHFRIWAASVLLAATVLPAAAQTTYPQKLVKIVVPFAPGGSSDNATRILAEQLGTKWKQSVIVENKPGANGTIGAAQVAKSPADGYTILLAPVSIATVKLFVKNPGFDPVNDLMPVTQIAQGDYVLSVHKDVPVNSMGEFAEYARKNPGKVFDGTFGGSSMLAFQQFADLMKFERQNVLYRGEALALNALLSGEVQAVLSTLTGAKPFIDSGRIKALGIPAKVRSPIAPNIRTADESGGKGFYADFWFGLMVPKGTPEDVRKKIGSDVAEALAKTEVKARLYSMGLIAKSSTAEEFGKLIQFEATRWVDAAKGAGLQPQ
ncbi:Bug family tripartite tricarboxylate transporter substrate binding protein [Noviherbaspirillum saxi]|uniref:Tripartite tricarboxylate transporter substrate binding protein n=1 Tax=Noviherbaspirillum saxi TaxID=2320863 RepID=A0A3A3FK46_9BURK|nr:tripartite tricarboxylate transporter substrate binding protein [Noviherbaspirillum saxi]RJF95081.1 tripartite tricarboxylate transporter substrate binding protein [Noviherbaspirillum saxi]